MSSLEISRRAPLRALLGMAVAGLVGCASSQPVLYPNPHLGDVGKLQSEQDIAECRAEATAAVEDGRAEEVARRAGESGVVGGVTGAAVGGIVRGHSVGRGAAAGAAAGVVSTVARAMFRWNEPETIEKAWVNRCLGQRGYDVIGWE